MVIFGSPNTLGHSPKARLVVTTVNRHVSATKRVPFRGALARLHQLALVFAILAGFCDGKPLESLGQSGWKRL